MNSFASTLNSSAQLQDYYDDKGTTVSTPTQEALKKRRKKQKEKLELNQDLIEEEEV